ncbi:unnamed protein product [Miscanthus lutarioriparius]|uniref:Complex III subunit 9 n=1 Tax=Miscanthus lutarioriparius TaxID=422564 RepID=A0A811Q3B6_9POAL|nr:unnamed protein product [Miscanthus lutarioriparius]
MGILDALYRVVMRRNAVYVTFVVAGAFAGERAVDYGVHKIWEMNNLGRSYVVAQINEQCKDYCQT